MNAQKLQEKLATQLRQVSRLERKREYVGISNVGKCPRQAYNDLMRGVQENDFVHQMAYAGYLFEQDALARLAALGFLRPDMAGYEVVCPVRPEVRGHVDGETTLGDLLEIKSVSRRKFDILRGQNRPLHEHVDQVQLYMRYGDWNFCQIIYICRETFEHKVFDVTYNPGRAQHLEEKLFALADAVAGQADAPACVCGKCGGAFGERMAAGDRHEAGYRDTKGR